MSPYGLLVSTGLSCGRRHKTDIYCSLHDSFVYVTLYVYVFVCMEELLGFLRARRMIMLAIVVVYCCCMEGKKGIFSCLIFSSQQETIMEGG